MSLNVEQQATLDHYAIADDCSIFEGVHWPNGEVEVIVLGEGWIWSIIVDSAGNSRTSEATVSDFDTGLTV